MLYYASVSTNYFSTAWKLPLNKRFLFKLMLFLLGHQKFASIVTNRLTKSIKFLDKPTTKRDEDLQAPNLQH